MTAHATAFEERYQTLLHLLLIGLAVLTYLRYPVDIVWTVVQHRADARSFERVAFGAAATARLTAAPARV